jgi:hypothetical protein
MSNINIYLEETKEVVRIAGYSIRAASFFLIVLYLILKTISLEQLTTERQGYKFLTVYHRNLFIRVKYTLFP